MASGLVFPSRTESCVGLIVWVISGDVADCAKAANVRTQDAVNAAPKAKALQPNFMERSKQESRYFRTVSGRQQRF
jgi:hypothetical protein